MNGFKVALSLPHLLLEILSPLHCRVAKTSVKNTRLVGYVNKVITCRQKSKYTCRVVGFCLAGCVSPPSPSPIG